jgi:hypothetical protein
MTQGTITQIFGRDRPSLLLTALAGWMLVLPTADFAAGGVLIFVVDCLIVG